MLRIFDLFHSKKISEALSENARLKHQYEISLQLINAIKNRSVDVDFFMPFRKENALVDSMLHMYEHLQRVSDAEQQQRWVQEGLAKFVTLLRIDTNDTEKFYDNLISQIVKYTEANQGGIFIADDKDTLELAACYAYNRKKYLEKKINIKEGLLGQCFQEKEMIYLKEIPQGYLSITSGLGEATPKHLLLMPLKYDQQVMGVLELASFSAFEKKHFDFLQKLSESIALVIMNIKNNEMVHNLLRDSQEKAAQLHEQEEEMRQNMEELMATQEEMEQKQSELNQKSNMLQLIIDNIPFPVFVKDSKGHYVLVNKAEAALFSLPESEIIGKSDEHFIKDISELSLIKKSDQQAIQSMQRVELPEQNFTLPNGKSYVFKTTKIPFINTFTNEVNILGVSEDITEKMALQLKLKMLTGSKEC
ncbi:MAG: GAF domain-containing protein [Cytophagaceae bacterium]|nr:GAF domain-containing protein [Cytophagaceae bacterium]MDW8455938.1 GAF domain-containing protein [Cytophagaceae bacterium]